MKNISLTEICWLLASCCAVVISTPIMGHNRDSSQRWGRWREAHDPLNERAPSGLCMCPLYCIYWRERGGDKKDNLLKLLTIQQNKFAALFSLSAGSALSFASQVGQPLFTHTCKQWLWRHRCSFWVVWGR